MNWLVFSMFLFILMFAIAIGILVVGDIIRRPSKDKDESISDVKGFVALLTIVVICVLVLIYME